MIVCIQVEIRRVHTHYRSFSNIMIIFPWSNQCSSHDRGVINTQSSKPYLDRLEEGVVQALATGELHSLEIQAALPSTCRSCPFFLQSSLYSALHRLEQRGLIVSRMSSKGVEKRSGNRRKYYQLAQQSSNFLFA
jgi:Transcriptional regulator PadR-like family